MPKGFPLRGSCQARKQDGKRQKVNSRLTDEVIVAKDEAAGMKSGKSPHPTCAKLLDSSDGVASAQATFPSRGRLLGLFVSGC